MVRHAQVHGMQRHRSQPHRRQRHLRQRGFTLVELLVVITIIGVLMAMLIPVIGRVREYAHRVACINNQKEIGLAMTGFAMTKGQMPYEMSPSSDTSVNPIPTIGWAEGLMSQLGRADLVPNPPTFTEAMLRTAAPNISILICPSDPTKAGATGAPESYVVNGGCSNNLSATPVDWNANGAWNYHVGTPAAGTANQNTSISLEFIFKHDGTSNTISHSENLDAPGWIVTTTAENTQAILWGPSLVPSGYNATSNPTGPINIGVGTTPSNLDMLARPSSNHPGGAVVAFCDGSVKFIQQTLAYPVYAMLMTSNGPQAAPPGTAFVANNSYQAMQVITSPQYYPLTASEIPSN